MEGGASRGGGVLECSSGGVEEGTHIKLSWCSYIFIMLIVLLVAVVAAVIRQRLKIYSKVWQICHWLPSVSFSPTPILPRSLDNNFKWKSSWQVALSCSLWTCLALHFPNSMSAAGTVETVSRQGVGGGWLATPTEKREWRINLMNIASVNECVCVQMATRRTAI